MKKYPRLFALLVALLFACLTGSGAEAPKPDSVERIAEISKRVANLKPQSGDIVLHDGLAKAALPAHLRYLNPTDAATVLTDIWGNPKGGRTLGMIVPADFNPLNDESWAVVITFEEDGYVKDDDAGSIDYQKLLGEMQESAREASAERVKQGYPAIEIVGWASPPRYDAVAKKLYWAKELKFGGSPEHTLNYNLRLLGRRGVLNLNAVAGMKQLKLVETATPGILAAVNFQDGHRYADFKEDTDKVATYGLAALVAGGFAAKAGLFKGLWIAALAFKKFIIIGLIVLAASAKKIWIWFINRKKIAAPTDVPPPAA